MPHLRLGEGEPVGELGQTDPLYVLLKGAHERLCEAQVVLGGDEEGRELLQQALDRIELVRRG